MPSNFDELYNMLVNQGSEGAEPLPSTIYDDLRETYTNDISTRDAKISEFDQERNSASERVKELEAELSRQKARNYDLMNTGPAAGGDQEPEQDSGGENEPRGIDSLFERKN